MFNKILGAALALGLLAGPAAAACEQDFDAITKAISGPVTMDAGHRAAMMRRALSGYDHCMSGDTQSFASVREQLMKQLRQDLGGNN
ncbi:MAG: hypothetical protein ACKVP4_04355 [Hyphomicrobium sp.]